MNINPTIPVKNVIISVDSLNEIYTSLQKQQNIIDDIVTRSNIIFEKVLLIDNKDEFKHFYDVISNLPCLVKFYKKLN